VHYLRAVLQPASLYSMRLPYTHQSALTYPLPPPSTILGMLAAALQRAEDRPPLECLEEIEDGVETCAALADEGTPIVARSCVVSLITKIQSAGEGKVTDALPRQFAHTHEVTILAFSGDRELLDRTCQAVQRAPITLGGSESLAAVSDLETGEATEEHLDAGDQVTTRAYVPRDLLALDSLQANHSLFWVHERCLGAEKLTAYLYPVMLAGHLYWTEPVTGTLSEPAVSHHVGPDEVLCRGADRQ
jgi:CRISPR-associated Cas5-like protein